MDVALVMIMPFSLGKLEPAAACVSERKESSCWLALPSLGCHRITVSGPHVVTLFLPLAGAQIRTAGVNLEESVVA